MAVTSFDGAFSFKQDTIARLGRDRGPVKKMTKEEYERFCNSPAMKEEAYRDEAVRAKTSKRDKIRLETDPSFKPKDSDWDEQPAFAFDTGIDYYRVLGVDEYEILENVKKAFRRLSLVYHPDKTTGLDEETIAEYKGIFVELNQAYMVLGDNVTRRQYDRARDNKRIIDEMYGALSKRRQQFDAFDVLEQLARKKDQPAITVDVQVKMKLEKMFYGGIKCLVRRCICEGFDGFHNDPREYKMVVPPRCREGYKSLQKGVGDHHEKQKPDNLNFIFTSKPHPRVTRSGDHIELKGALQLGGEALRNPYVSAELEGLDGRVILLLGYNPFYQYRCSGTSRLRVAMKGEAFASDAAFKFDIIFPGSEDRIIAQARPGASQENRGRDVVVITNAITRSECHLLVDQDASVGDVIARLCHLHGLQGTDAGRMTLRQADDRGSSVRGPATLSAHEKIGARKRLLCHGCEWGKPNITRQRALAIAHLIDLALNDAEQILARRPEPLIQSLVQGSPMSSSHLPAGVGKVLPQFGFSPSRVGLDECLQTCERFCAEAIEECRRRIDALAVAEDGGVFVPVQRKAFSNSALRRRQLTQGAHHDCLAELEPLGEPFELATSPTSYLQSYGNLQQPAGTISTTNTSPRALFALVLSCPRGAKRQTRARWQSLKDSMVPLMWLTFGLLVRPARRLQPRSLDVCPTYYDEGEEENDVPIAFPTTLDKEGDTCDSMNGHMTSSTSVTSLGKNISGRQAMGQIIEKPRPRSPDLHRTLWKVIGGVGKGGILVRIGKELSSQQMVDRLSTGAVVQELELLGERLHYKKLVGDGPDAGWVSLKVSAKDLLVKMDAASAELSSEGESWQQLAEDCSDDPAESSTTATGNVLIETGAQLRTKYCDAPKAFYPRQAARIRLKRHDVLVDNAAPPPPMPWMRLGIAAFHRRDTWIAHQYFSMAASEAGFDLLAHANARDVDCTSIVSISEQGTIALDAAIASQALARRSDCLEYVGMFDDALSDAKASAQLQPSWSQIWRRVGVLAAKTGRAPEAWEALFKAIEFDVGDKENVNALQRFKWQQNLGRTAAREQLMAGHSRFKIHLSLAVAHYTAALSAMQAPIEHYESPTSEADARLLAEIHSNRSAAFAKLKLWDGAISDARRALSLPGREDWVKGLVRMGVALLGAGRHEAAYPYFARAEAYLPSDAPANAPAKLGRQACLSLTPLWKSRLGQSRLAKFWRGARRPRNNMRVFAVSDIHFDHPQAEQWVHRITDKKFQDDVLIVAGDVAENLVKLRECLRILRAKFSRVFFTPGNHDLWIHTTEEKDIPDSMDKFYRILQLCDEIDVDVFPAAICEGIFVVPLFSWYSADFDIDDPFPASFLMFDKFAKWPMDRDEQLWRYMLYLNRRALEMPYPGTVITFSHFLPRTELPFWGHVSGLAKAVGCPQLDEQIRQVQSEVHVFGHSHLKCDKVLEGVRYVQCPLGYAHEHERSEPIRCVVDGDNGLVSKLVSIT